ncbi:MAG: ABC transporter permease [Alphaproteobacteria bacterium]
MMKWIEISFKNVLRNSRRSITAILTVAIASVALIMSYGFLNATFWGLKRQTIQGGTGNIQVVDTRKVNGFEEYPLEFGIEKQDANEIEQKLMATKKVKQVLKRISFNGVVSTGEKSTIFSGLGIESKKENRLRAGNAVGRYLKGRKMKDGDNYQVELGVRLANKLGVDVGDGITLLANVIDGGINAIDVTVTGIYTTGIPEKDEISLKVPLGLVQELMGTERVSKLVVQLKKMDRTAQFQKSVGELNDKLTMVPWWDVEPYFKAVQNIYYNIFSIMGIIIAMVVLLSVTNVMNTSVMERAHEIGTLRSFGISKNNLRFNFMTEGTIISVIGSILGVVLSVGISIFINKAKYMMPPPPGKSQEYPLMIMMSLDSVIVVILAMVVIGIFASLMPINSILKKKIVEQISHV